MIWGGLHWYLVSERIRQLFINNDIVGVQFLPVKVVHKKNYKEIGTFWVINVMQSVKSLRWNLINDMDIFRRRTDTFVSNRLRKLMIQNEANRGVGFLKMPTRLIDRKESLE